MAIIAACTCGPTSIGVPRKCPVWCSVWIAAVHAYRLPEDNLDTALYALWKREMPFPSYRPHWLNCRLEDGTQVQALGFVLERHLPSYAGNLPDHVLSQVFASASGRYGTTRDYVEQTAHALRSHAMPDRNLEARLKRCKSHSDQATASRL